MLLSCLLHQSAYHTRKQFYNACLPSPWCKSLLCQLHSFSINHIITTALAHSIIFTSVRVVLKLPGARRLLSSLRILVHRCQHARRIRPAGSSRRRSTQMTPLAKRCSGAILQTLLWCCHGCGRGAFDAFPRFELHQCLWFPGLAVGDEDNAACRL